MLNYLELLHVVFKKSKEDYFLVSKQLGSLLEVILIYVNNKIITRNDDLEAIETVKDYLHKKFKLKDLDHLKYFVDIEVIHSKDEIYLAQFKYVLEKVEELGFIRAQSS